MVNKDSNEGSSVNHEFSHADFWSHGYTPINEVKVGFIRRFEWPNTVYASFKSFILRSLFK